MKEQHAARTPSKKKVNLTKMFPALKIGKGGYFRGYHDTVVQSSRWGKKVDQEILRNKCRKKQIDPSPIEMLWGEVGGRFGRQIKITTTTTIGKKRKKEGERGSANRRNRPHWTKPQIRGEP